MSLVETLTEFAKPFAHFYNHSKPLSIGTTYVHLASMLGAGGLAVASDRMTLRLTAGDRRLVSHVTEQSNMHRAVIIGLVLSAASGVMMFFSDVETFLVSPLYWTKISAVVLLLVNGAVLTGAEKKLIADPSDGAAFGRLQWTARLSLFLWFLTALLGTVLRTEA